MLIGAPEPRHRDHKVRAVEQENPAWYKSLCDQYQSSRRRRSRKSDTKIKRRDTVRALERIIAGRMNSTYVERLMPFVAEKLKEMQAYGPPVGESLSYRETRAAAEPPIQAARP